MQTVGTTSTHSARWLAAVVSTVLLLTGGSTHAVETGLRVCADPNNPPFSRSTGDPKGFYLEIADRIASALGRTPEPVWHLTYFGQRAVRDTLIARECDLYVGLPSDSEFMGGQLLLSEPFAVFAYALVQPRDVYIERLADLRGRRVAVQFASPPQSLLATAEDVVTVTVLSPEEGMRALADGRADAAYLWGPSAGYLNKYVYEGRYQIVPTEGQAMSWHVVIGFRREDRTLRNAVQSVLDTLGPRIRELEAKYGFPSGAPVRLASATSDLIGAAPGAVTGSVAQAGVPAENTPSVDTAAAARGRALFNSNCSHCHGANAASPETRTDLRRLRRRYGTQTDEVFSTTVRDGRPEKGMPLWKGVLSDDDLAAVKAFVDSVQQSK
jgi:polar amino acid transport system substrate-binding protein